MADPKTELKTATLIYGGMAARNWRIGKRSVTFGARDPSDGKGPQTVQVEVECADGVVVQPAGGNLARLVASGDLQVAGVRLPSIGSYQTRAQILAAEAAA